MKKVFTILIALVLLVSMMGAVSGVEVTEENLSDGPYTSDGVPVTLTLLQSFTITLPAGFNFELDGDYYSDNESFSVAVNRLNSTAILYVNVSSPNYDGDLDQWNLTRKSDGHEISYLMGVSETNTMVLTENEVPNGGAIYYSPAKGTSESVSKYLHVKIPIKAADLKVAGIYTDTLTFTVKIDEDQ